MWGEWDVTDNSCLANWGNIEDKGCTEIGHKTYYAKLYNVPPGQSWDNACNTTSININGNKISTPTRCVNRGGDGFWGEWDVPDNTCGTPGTPMTDLETNYYYRLEMKRSLILPYKESLKIDYTGTARFSSPIEAERRTQKEMEAEKLQEEDFGVFYDWLFVPTGEEGEYWMFNRGAQGGSGEVLTLPQGKKEFGQWELIEEVEEDSYGPDDDENRQKFTLLDEGDGYYTLRLRYKGKNERENVLVENSTYANPGVGVDVSYHSNRLFKMIKREKASCDDILVSSMLWNNSDTIVQNYVLDLCKSEDASTQIPGPKALKLKKLVFINNKAGNNEVKIYKFGCLGEDVLLSNGRVTCEKMNFKSKDEIMIFKVDNYLRNSEKIWAVIGEGAFWTANVILTGLTAGASAPVSAGLTAGGIAANSIKTIVDVANSEDETEAIVLGANHLGSSTFATVDAVTDAIPIEASAAGNIILLGLGGASIIEQGMSISDGGTPVTEEMLLDTFGLTEDINPQLESYIPQRFIMAIKDEAFTELMKDWTITKNGIEYYDKMYYGGGTAYFFND